MFRIDIEQLGKLVPPSENQETLKAGLREVGTSCPPVTYLVCSLSRANDSGTRFNGTVPVTVPSQTLATRTLSLTAALKLK